MKKDVSVEIRRFGCSFRVNYRAGRTIDASDSQAALYRDDVFLTWLGVGSLTAEWSDVYLDLDESLSDKCVLVEPETLGMNPTTEEDIDLMFILEAQDYIIELLSNAFRQKLSSTDVSITHCQTPVVDPRMIHPRERGLRVAEIWHNHGCEKETLPILVTLEVYDAIEGFGYALADLVDTDKEMTSEGKGGYIRDLVDSAFKAWRDVEGDEDEEGG